MDEGAVVTRMTSNDCTRKSDLEEMYRCTRVTVTYHCNSYIPCFSDQPQQTLTHTLYRGTTSNMNLKRKCIDLFSKINDLLLAYNFDLDLSEYKYSDLKPFIFRDKKVQKGKLNLVLLKGISSGIVTSAFDIKNLPRSMR